MVAFIGTAGGNVELTDPKVEVGGANTDVQEIWVGTAGGNELVWFRQPLAVSAAALAWDDAQLTITPPGSGADSYTIIRNGATIATGVTNAGTDPFTWDDLDTLLPSTSYTYRVQAIRGGVTVGDVTAAAITTPAYADLGLTATAPKWDTVNLSWAAANGSVDSFELKRSSTVIYTGTGTSKSDTGRAASTTYSYTLTAKRGSTVIKTDTASVTTPARTKAYGSLSYTTRSGWRWNQSTGANPVQKIVSVPRDCYVSQIRFQCGGYYAQSSITKIKWKLAGVTGGTWFTLDPESGSDSGWTQWLSCGDQSLGSGDRWIGFERSTSYPTQWDYGPNGESDILFDLDYWYWAD